MVVQSLRLIKYKGMDVFYMFVLYLSRVAIQIAQPDPQKMYSLH